MWRGMMHLTHSTLSVATSVCSMVEQKLKLKAMITPLLLRVVVALVVVSSASASASPPTTQYWVVMPPDGNATIETCRIACSNTSGNTTWGVGGWVATVKNQYEQELLQKVVNHSMPSVPLNPNIGALLGASRSPSNRSQFRWIEGPINGTVFWVGLNYSSSGAHAIGYTNFRLGQPRDYGGNEDSLQIYRSDGTWNDFDAPSSIVTACACQSLPTASASVSHDASSSSVSQSLVITSTASTTQSPRTISSPMTATTSVSLAVSRATLLPSLSMSQSESALLRSPTVTLSHSDTPRITFSKTAPRSGSRKRSDSASLIITPSPRRQGSR